MEGGGWCTSIFVGFIAGAIAYTLGYLVRSQRRTANKSTDLVQQQASSHSKKKDEMEGDSKNQTASGDDTTLGKLADEAVVSENDIKLEEMNNESTESTACGNEEPEKELTVKEKFYMFLDKGFCPELEQGVDDPMYKYFGGRSTDNAEGLPSVEEIFCPFRGGLAGDDDDDDDESTEDNGERNDIDKYKKEVDELERIIKEKMKNGGKCPFNKGSSSEALPRVRKESEKEKRPMSTEELQSLIGKSGGACPFKFAVGPTADSEDEADMPKKHGKHGSCPLKPKVTTPAEDKGKENGVAETVTEDSDKNSDDSGPQKLPQVALKDTLDCIAQGLSAEERALEEAARQQQIAAIMRLMENHNDGQTLDAATDIQSQLRMYI